MTATTLTLWRCWKGLYNALGTRLPSGKEHVKRRVLYALALKKAQKSRVETCEMPSAADRLALDTGCTGAAGHARR